MSDSVVANSERAIAQGSQSFAAAARLFDKQTRDDAVMLYAWCRHCDDVVDGQTLGHAQQAKLPRRTNAPARPSCARNTAAVLAGRAERK
jgi:phytoene synthase